MNDIDHALYNDTIAAVITAPGIGAMAALRISGPGAFEAASGVFHSKNGRAVSELAGYSVTFGSVYAEGCFLDQALMLKMKAPHSFTGEDVAELQCHGGHVVVSRLMDALTHTSATGAASMPLVRLAEPGEFSLRAFLNGKMALSQAEAVMELVGAGNVRAAQIAARQLAGGLARHLDKLGKDILGLLADIEVAVDFPEESFGESSEEGIKSFIRQCRTLLEEIDALIACADRGRLYKEGIKVVFYGRPNAGKSSLLNGVLKEPRAIVTPEPGTTRDVLEERILLRGLPLVLTDTAGVRASGSSAEAEGVARAKAIAAKADLVLYVADAGEGLTAEDESLLEELDESSTIVVLNKADLAAEIKTAEAETAIPEAGKAGKHENHKMRGEATGRVDAFTGTAEAVAGSLRAAGRIWQYCRLSALSPDDLTFLAERIRTFFNRNENEKRDSRKDGVSVEGTDHGELILNRRQSETLQKMRQSLAAAVMALETGVPADIAAIEIRQAWIQLGELTGELLQPALVERIFSDFCLGK